MCMICHKTPCDPRCPMAPDPPEAAACKRCGESIRVGDEYAVIDGVAYCEPCIDDMTYGELVTLCGGDWKTAEMEDVYDGYDG